MLAVDRGRRPRGAAGMLWNSARGGVSRLIEPGPPA